MTRQLPENPSLSSLKYQAKQLLKSHKARDQQACAILRLHTRFASMTDGDILGSSVSLMEVQHALALSYGFSDWKTLLDQVAAARETPEFSPEDLRVSLERMFRSGRLRALPKRGRDRKIFLALAASRLTDEESTEKQINRQLEDWLDPIANPRALDHLQVRRALIDNGLLHRTFGGGSYWPDRELVVGLIGSSKRWHEPARILETLEAERAQRKREWAARQS